MWKNGGNFKFNNGVSIDVDVESVLTPKTCSTIVVEMLKFLAYQKLQIPYDYERLKYVVEKKREKSKRPEDVEDSWHSQTYFRTTSNAVETLESIFKNLYLEFNQKFSPKEICIVFGTNTLCPKEIYRILIPDSIKDHFYENHLNDSKHLIHNVLRHLVCSEDLTKFVYQSIKPTNMYVLVKRKIDADCHPRCDNFTSNFFLPVDSLYIPPRTPHVVINLAYKPVISSINCCNRLEIYNDTLQKCDDERESPELNKQNIDFVNSFDDKDWFEANVFLKGFKASFVNGQSVSDLWTK